MKRYMIEKLKSVKKIPVGARAAIAYTLANVFSRGIAIITMPIFTRLMSTTQIGEVNLYNSWFSMFYSISTLSLTAGGFSVAMKEYEGIRKQYISSILTLTSLIAGIFSALYFINMDFWNNLTGLSTSLMMLILIGLFVSPATDFWLLYERYEYRYANSTFLSMGSAFFASILSLGVILFMNQNGCTNLAEGRLIANCVVVYSIAMILWIVLMHRGKTFVNFQYWKFSLSLSLPLVGYSIVSQILGVSDRMMISKMVNNSAVGIYSTVYSVGTLFTMVWTAINSSFVPYLYQNIGQNDKNIKETSFFLLVIYGMVAVVMVLFAPEILGVLATEEYFEGIYLMPPIAAGVFLTSVANIYSNILLYMKTSKHILASTCIAAFLNVALNYWLIPVWGYMVAAYTTLLSYIVMMLLLMMAAKCQFQKQESKSLNSIYSNSKIIILSIIIILAMLFVTVLYSTTIIRYTITMLLILVVVYLGFKYLKMNNQEE